ncbi:MAG: hypothetical protein UZ07_CHB004002188 [Chlorobi bacterium OLB7]|nr:MAG: hypothetical protein UZ07_CHB004002188 [Chlorobi bacterium OLB7]
MLPNRPQQRAGPCHWWLLPQALALRKRFLSAAAFWGRFGGRVLGYFHPCGKLALERRSAVVAGGFGWAGLGAIGVRFHPCCNLVVKFFGGHGWFCCWLLLLKDVCLAHAAGYANFRQKYRTAGKALRGGAPRQKQQSVWIEGGAGNAMEQIRHLPVYCAAKSQPNRSPAHT